MRGLINPFRTTVLPGGQTPPDLIIRRLGAHCGLLLGGGCAQPNLGRPERVKRAHGQLASFILRHQVSPDLARSTFFY